MFNSQQKKRVGVVLSVIGVIATVYLFQQEREERAAREFFNIGKIEKPVKQSDFFNDGKDENKGKIHHAV
ncbi:MAG: hypothetical protein K0S27_1675 [Gammaproteobacteria bacterium]|nr:hypothetical protein [Gammaproteobacteria bacterium]